MKILKEKKGFTLIELAIVLVIIGIIIGAVIKGQDLIEGARHKKFTNEVKKWETVVWAYLDRKGNFPGDGGRNGIIGDNLPIAEDPKTDLIGSGLIGVPESNAITMGGHVFYFYLGNAGATAAKKNLIAICKTTDCNGTFTVDEVEYAKSFDIAFDGADDGTKGSVRGTTDDLSEVADQWEVNHGSAPTLAAYSSATRAVLFYFDRRP